LTDRRRDKPCAAAATASEATPAVCKALVAPAAASAPALNLDEVIEIPQVGMPPIRSEVRNIIQELDRKSSQSGNVQKYLDALQQLRQSGVTAADVAGILRRNGIDYKNNRIMGGKNSKKNRKKQKGGFRYNKHSKRRSISSKSSRTSRTSRTSR
jgi:hypothetical protein